MQHNWMVKRNIIIDPKDSWVSQSGSSRSTRPGTRTKEPTDAPIQPFPRADALDHRSHQEEVNTPKTAERQSAAAVRQVRQKLVHLPAQLVSPVSLRTSSKPHGAGKFLRFSPRLLTGEGLSAVSVGPNHTVRFLVRTQMRHNWMVKKNSFIDRVSCQ